MGNLSASDSDDLIEAEFQNIKTEIRKIKFQVKRVASERKDRRVLFSPPSVSGGAPVTAKLNESLSACPSIHWWQKAIAGLVVIPGGVYLGYKWGKKKRKTRVVTRTQTIYRDREVRVPVEVPRPPTMEEIKEYCEQNPLECG